MKKLLLFFVLIMSVLCTAQAGYIIKGISTPLSFGELKNYTLTFDKDGVPISAASMHLSASGAGKNNIVIIRSNSTTSHIFSIVLPGDDVPPNVEVRDFIYYPGKDIFLLCGSRQVGTTHKAFVAVIDGYLTQLELYEYPNADMFYSICVPFPNSSSPVLSDYYLCGTRGSIGVIASVNGVSFNLTHFYTTTVEWEYNKIITKRDPIVQELPHFVVSGKKPDNTWIGFTTLDPLFNITNSYMWEQMTEQGSHCVVGDDILSSNAVILASSYGNTVTLNPVTYPVFGSNVIAYRYTLPGYRYYLQDIGTNRITTSTYRISVAGIRRDQFPALTMAWHGYVPAISTASPMRNNYYSETGARFENYKIRYQDPGALLSREYTGGFYQNANEMCALFGNPLAPFDAHCDNLYTNNPPMRNPIPCYLLPLQSGIDQIPSYGFRISSIYLLLEDFCGTFKGEESAPEMVMAVKNENEITAYYDRIALKDIPENTNYQIYTVTGQLIQSGATTPYISTAQLSKGIYVLRLENGKAYKFVK